MGEYLSENTGYISNPYGEHIWMLNFIRFRGPFDEKINDDIYWDLKDLKKLWHQSDYYLKVLPKNTKEYKNWIFEDTDFSIKLAYNIINQFKKDLKILKSYFFINYLLIKKYIVN